MPALVLKVLVVFFREFEFPSYVKIPSSSYPEGLHTGFPLEFL